MGRLRDKMDGDLKLHGRCQNTRTAYLRCATMFVRHYMKSPEQLGKTEVRDYLLQMLEQRKWTAATYNVHAAALKFLYAQTLERPQEVAWIGWMRQVQRLPAILSAEEIERLLDALGSLRMQVIVMTAYGAGLRVSEVLKLRVEDIDSARMVIHVRHGKGDRDLERVLKEFQDHLAPRLDTYEQAIHFHLFRHTRLIGVEEAVVGFKSARRRMACGIGQNRRPMSENTAYVKLQSLQRKGCIVIVDSTRDGRKIQIRLPHEIPGVVVAPAPQAPPDLEEEDFFAVPSNRERILEREGRRCFYCLRHLTPENHVIEHVVSRPAGGNGYRNVVAACRECNNHKNSSTAEDWLRALYREGFLDAVAFRERQSYLERLCAGELKPPQASG